MSFTELIEYIAIFLPKEKLAELIANLTDKQYTSVFTNAKDFDFTLDVYTKQLVILWKGEIIYHE